jgi:Ran-binding protein 1
MKLQPNIGSDRSWVWKVAADYSENPPTAETLAIRFANSDCWYTYLSIFQSLIPPFFSSSGAVQESI